MFMYHIICTIHMVHIYISDDSRAIIICPFDTELLYMIRYVSYDIRIMYHTILINMSVVTTLSTSSFLFLCIYILNL